MIPFIKRFSYLHLNNLDDLQPEETEVKGIVPSPHLADFVRDVETPIKLQASWTSRGLLHTTTRPMNCYAVSTRLRRYGHHLWMYPLHHGQNPHKIQTAPGYYKTDELLHCFNKITTLQTFFFSLPSGRGQPFVNQESVNQESVKCLLKGRRVFWN
ncbi:hypothetical protein TNCV_3290371 [Trichonephila clavipes]|nr:hypothetical protein TNCV_3290371 [Trichonephila clavipes]